MPQILKRRSFFAVMAAPFCAAVAPTAPKPIQALDGHEVVVKLHLDATEFNRQLEAIRDELRNGQFFQIDGEKLARKLAPHFYQLSRDEGIRIDGRR
jgi:hypothetical protein